MKVLAIITAIIACVAIFLLAAKPAGAETIVTQERTESIKLRCVENQAALNRLQQNDASLRSNLGNVYRTINDKLMATFAARLEANEIDNDPFEIIRTDYNEQYGSFYDAYIDYDKSLTSLLQTDCTKEPVGFYNALMNLRETRKKLSDQNQKLLDHIQDYKDAFKQLYDAQTKGEKS